MTSTSQAGAVFVEPLAEKPKLVFALSGRDGRSRRLDAYLAQVLQRRHNHDTSTSSGSTSISVQSWPTS
jgi:hypothetical protein